jgi:hypothetical protein
VSHGLERLFSPSFLDIIFPFFAFVLVIVLPSVFAVSAIIRVLRGQYLGEDQREVK